MTRPCVAGKEKVGPPVARGSWPGYKRRIVPAPGLHTQTCAERSPPAMSALTRRRFLQQTLAAAATVTIAGTKSSAKVLGANDRVRVAVCGLHGRGGEHLKQFG